VGNTSPKREGATENLEKRDDGGEDAGKDTSAGHVDLVSSALGSGGRSGCGGAGGSGGVGNSSGSGCRTGSGCSSGGCAGGELGDGLSTSGASLLVLIKGLLELRLDGRIGLDTALSTRLERVVDRRGAEAVQVNSAVSHRTLDGVALGRASGSGDGRLTGEDLVGRDGGAGEDEGGRGGGDEGDNGDDGGETHFGSEKLGLWVRESGLFNDWKVGSLKSAKRGRK